MKRWFGVMIFAAILGATGGLRAATPTTAPATSAPTTNPAQNISSADLSNLISQLSADDFDVREDALKKLQGVVGDNMRNMVMLQEALNRLQQSLVDQLKVLTSAQDLEAVARTAGLMEFNEAISHWAAECMQLPEPERVQVLKWGLSDEGMHIVGKAYSPQPALRAEGIAAMAKVPGTAVSILLANMINDPDRQVSLTAIDALWDRAPTPQALSALWSKSITSLLAAYGYAGNRTNVRTRQLNFHGRPINIVVGNVYNNGNVWEDSALATDVLIHWQSPDTAAHLKDFLTDLLARPNNQSYFLFQMLLPEYGGQGQNLQRLVTAFHPKEIVNIYIRYITNPGANNGNGGENEINGKKYRYGPRIGMIAGLCRATNQETDSYGIKRVPQFGNQYVIEGSQKEEDAAVAKVNAWWDQHKTEYEDKPAATQSATQSATQKN